MHSPKPQGAEPCRFTLIRLSLTLLSLVRRVGVGGTTLLKLLSIYIIVPVEAEALYYKIAQILGYFRQLIWQSPTKFTLLKLQQYIVIAMDNPSKKLTESKLKASKLSLKESLMGACTNIVYRLGAIGGLKRMPQLLKSQEGTKAMVILGEAITDRMVAQQRLLKIIWFTYREKLRIAEDINSDVGWGCLPRVGQMVLAQALTRCTIYREGKQLDREQLMRIIRPFLDEAQGETSYSLSTILKHARYKFNISPGQWFNIGQLSEVLRKMYEEKPFAGCEHLKVVFFSQSVIFMNNIIQKANLNKCQCLQKQLLCLKCNRRNSITHEVLQSYQGQKDKEIQCNTQFQSQHSEKTKLEHKSLVTAAQEKSKGWLILDEGCFEQALPSNLQKGLSLQEQCELENHLLLIVSVRPSEKHIDAMDFASIKSLLSLPSSVGMIGGVPSKALYIVGYEGDDAVYLDPHYVQQHVTEEDLAQKISTFCCSEFRTISKQALDPCMAFCFYLRSVEDIQALLSQLNGLRNAYEERQRGFFISVMETDYIESDQGGMHFFGEGTPPPEFGRSLEYNSLEFQHIRDSQ